MGRVRLAGPPHSSPGRGVSLSRPRAGPAPLFAGGVVLRSPARAPGCYQCSPGGVALHSFARAPGPPHSSPGAWYFALPRAALVPLLARGRDASLFRPRAGPPTCGTLVSAAGLAQLVEQLSCKQQVIGSSPIAGSIFQLTRIRPVVWLALAGSPVFPCYCGKVGARLIRT